MKEFLKDFWANYSYIHNTTKTLYILSEEYDDELSSFIQPIKEQKDSLEHIVRAYSRYASIEGPISKEDEKYITQNLDKAMGHTFRSFFDCADVLSIILREKLSVELSRFTYSKIVTAWPAYEEYRKVLVEMPDRVAKLRTNKDVASGKEAIINMVKEYKENIDELFKIYNTFMKDIYPILNK